MELYRKVRLACAEGMSARSAAKHFGISRDSVKKMLSFSVPPGYIIFQRSGVSACGFACRAPFVGCLVHGDRPCSDRWVLD